jgi:hypothetical protein
MFFFETASEALTIAEESDWPGSSLLVAFCRGSGKAATGFGRTVSFFVAVEMDVLLLLTSKSKSGPFDGLHKLVASLSLFFIALP